MFAKILKRIPKPQRLMVFFIPFAFLWILYLAKIQLDLHRLHLDKDYLRERIVELSKEYVKAVAKDRSENSTPGLLKDKVSDLKQTTALLLENMLNRLQMLEKQVENVVAQSAIDISALSQKVNALNQSLRSFAGNFTNSHSFMQCFVPDDPEYPDCASKVEWMEEHWESHPKYAANDVNGSLCSILKYLSEVEDFCPKNSYQHTWSSVNNGCTIPKKTSSYPSCAEKVQWMREHWKSDPCYERDFGVNGTLCSFLIYLSEVESWCPRLPGAKHISSQNLAEKNISKVDLRGTSLKHLIGKLTNVISESRLNWIRSRVVRMYSYWEKGRRELKKRVNIVDKPRMKILIHIGVLAEETRLHFAQTADKGGPLGELVQWGDIIASLYTLGHDIYVTVEHSEMLSLLVGNDDEMKRSCPPKDGRRKFDLFFTDYYGLSRLRKKANQLLDQFRCTLRIVDSFGTEAQFNYNGESPELGSPAALGLNLYGKNNLNLKQYMTMFPHSPDNTFLGFIVDSKDNVPESVSKTKISLTYGKHYSMWKDLKNREFLDIIHEKFKIHATTGGLPLGQVKNYLPEYVVNHGVVGSAKLLKLLKESTIFIGLGFPYEGPAPLEAIAQGCFFINPKFKTARNRENTPFFKGKPTFRALTSQHPYAEEFIGEPRVLTIDIEDREAVTEALEKIINSKPSPYLPFEFTHEGMLERVNALIHNQDFCNKEPATIWPPLTSRIVITALIGQSCKDACLKQGLVCEPAYFESINKEEFFLRASFPCSMEQRKRRNSLVAPAYVGSENICVLQAEPLLYSCTTRSEYVKRICPCRKYRKGQVALCKTCY